MAFIPKYILILAVTIVVDYFAGLLIYKAQDKSKKIYLIISILCNVGFLFIFKYFNFFNSNLSKLASLLHWNYTLGNLSIVLPIGLSFHTFQSMSYIIEVYRGNQKPERHFGIYALYVMFYPQLVAGPIERPQNLLHQFHEKKTFDSKRVIDGLQLMLWGMFKKVVIADNLALLVNSVYDNPANYKGLSLVIATYFFAFQIYSDFSGYTDIARGAARVMGFELMKNFKRPYFAKSVPEFWRRWHISLTSWFKDYVYISLGGNRKGLWKQLRNTMIVFLLSGLWHGANWTYVIWGGLNGIFILISVLTSKFRKKLLNHFKIDNKAIVARFIKVIITFNLISFTWIFFRAKSINDAFIILKNICSSIMSIPHFRYVEAKFDLLLGCILIGILLLVQLFQRKYEIRKLISEKPILLRSFVYASALIAILLLGATKSSDFIYFQF
jgi:D-alanyl-lipoteichoic acid acyltransferase DltB (MBOAT superfamily)